MKQIFNRENNMTTLFDAFNAETGRTHNGAVTNHTSFSHNLDLFNIIGSSRGKDLTVQFDKALKENPELALRMVQWVRDCRGGAGEREMFRSLLRSLVRKPEYRETSIQILRKVPMLGYWKDVIRLYNVPEFQPTINEMIAVALAAEDALCAKYLPRKGPVAATIRNALGLPARDYRRMIVRLSNTVEQKMCARQWNEIDFNKIPSLAAARYQKAFVKNAQANYEAYINALEKGDAKINAAGVYPYDVLKSVMSGVAAVADQQWKALPNYMEGTNEQVLPLIDVSGSMHCPTAINGVSCMTAAIGLGMYLSERAPGKFKNHYMTFSERPRMEVATGTLSERYRSISRADWGGSTNIQAVFETLLDKAVKFSVPESEMPTMIVIMSDMEFNCSWIGGKSETAFRMIEDKYKKAGYTRPKLVFWNMNGRVGNSPVTLGEGGTAMISGLSPSILTSVLGAKDFNPYSIMLEALMVDKYAL